MELFRKNYWKFLRNSKFYRTENMFDWFCHFCLLCESTNFFWAGIKSFKNFFELPFSPNLSKLLQVALLKQHLSCPECRFKNRKSLQTCKIYSFSNFEQLLLDWGSAFFACSLWMKFLSNLIWKISDYYAFFRELGKTSVRPMKSAIYMSMGKFWAVL